MKEEERAEEIRGQRREREDRLEGKEGGEERK